jgi:hypothetical protein
MRCDPRKSLSEMMLVCDEAIGVLYCDVHRDWEVVYGSAVLLARLQAVRSE